MFPLSLVAVLDAVLLPAALPSCPHLTTLTLTRLPAVHAAIGMLSSWLADPACVLSTLDLSYCGITYLGAHTLVVALARCASVTHLNLRGNVLLDAGLKQLAKGLVANRTSRRWYLDVSDNGFLDSKVNRTLLRSLVVPVIDTRAVVRRGSWARILSLRLLTCPTGRSRVHAHARIGWLRSHVVSRRLLLRAPLQNRKQSSRRSTGTNSSACVSSTVTPDNALPTVVRVVVPQPPPPEMASGASRASVAEADSGNWRPGQDDCVTSFNSRRMSAVSTFTGSAAYRHGRLIISLSDRGAVSALCCVSRGPAKGLHPFVGRLTVVVPLLSCPYVQAQSMQSQSRHSMSSHPRSSVSNSGLTVTDDGTGSSAATMVSTAGRGALVLDDADDDFGGGSSAHTLTSHSSGVPPQSFTATTLAAAKVAARRNSLLKARRSSTGGGNMDTLVNTAEYRAAVS